ncbi:MAG: hypoxanthine-guanine phosphoribosyltransferase, partial [Anaerolineae bacterium]|nr:hypoxanthine-guanine phosphoribosyltransferase [Anaerolineae bacterium]
MTIAEYDATSQIQSMNRVFDEADCLATEHQVEQAIDAMAKAITGALSERAPLILCTMNGGLILTGKLLPKLVFPLQCDFIHATRYRHETSGGDIHWRVNPEIEMRGRHVLVVDDILDEGATLAAILKHCRDAGAAAVYSAVL